MSLLTQAKAITLRVFGRRVQASAVEGVPVRFMANENFFCPVMQSTYTAGMRYTVRAGNEKLAKQVQQWLGTGKVQLCAGDRATVHGRGYGN